MTDAEKQILNYNIFELMNMELEPEVGEAQLQTMGLNIVLSFMVQDLPRIVGAKDYGMILSKLNELGKEAKDEANIASLQEQYLALVNDKVDLSGRNLKEVLDEKKVEFFINFLKKHTSLLQSGIKDEDPLKTQKLHILELINNAIGHAEWERLPGLFAEFKSPGKD